MTPLWWSILLGVLGLVGVALTGRKNSLGWAVGIGTQFLWLSYALATRQYGFLLTAIGYGSLYFINWRKWRQEERVGSDSD